MGLPYPGGPEIEKLAATGNPKRIAFPKPLLPGTHDFSFSGLKSAVINYIHGLEQKGEPIYKADIAASFQETIV